jgi:hypothetical protein
VRVRGERVLENNSGVHRHNNMDTIITNGDFDFNIFASTPAPPVVKTEVATTANNKRKLEEDTRPTPSWVRGNNRFTSYSTI